MINAIDTRSERLQNFLETVVRAVSLTAEAHSCWPLEGYPDVAVWPMDAESLMDHPEDGGTAPADAILQRALAEEKWSAPGSCAAGSSCPFCSSRKVLAATRETRSLLGMLRWSELGTGKRWSFRDLFSLTSYLLAGSCAGDKNAAIDPCDWAAGLIAADKEAQLGGRPRRDSSTALYWLVSAQYQHALFHRWDSCVSASLLKDVKELGLHETDNTAMGLYYFLKSRATNYMPAMIASLLEDVVGLLDPAMASPDAEVVVWGATVTLGEFDIRFSRSVREGLDFSIKSRVLSQNERDLLNRLAELDELLTTPRLRRKRPTAATRIQRFIRDFSCRIVRRSIGGRQAIVPDAATLGAYERVVADASGRGYELREVANQIEDLLNNNHDFDVSLTTTFGQPLPPVRNRATLVVPRQRVHSKEARCEGRPRPSVCFLDVEVGSDMQAIALTYDLFKALRDLDQGLSQASLPHSVLALLDTTRARMAGAIVRDQGVRERPMIILGENLVIERHRGQFASSKRGRYR